jgi:hypothetical protein
MNPAPTHTGHHPGHGEQAHGATDMAPYRRLLASLVLSYVVMFAVMYARVDEFDHVYLGFNQAYMAGLMVAPMLLVMMATMRPMFGNARLNAALVAVGIALTAAFWILLRQQVGVDDRQMMRSMIPHHSGAILVCTRASLVDADVRRLCAGIIESQQREIREMKALLGQS